MTERLETRMPGNEALVVITIFHLGTYILLKFLEFESNSKIQCISGERDLLYPVPFRSFDLLYKMLALKISA